MLKSANKSTQCAEHGIWTSAPTPPRAGQKPLNFSAIDAKENQRIISSEKMSFAMVGCSGDPATGKKTKAVAKAMIAAGDTSFFYHLGDIIYLQKGSDANTNGSQDADTPELWNSQFYARTRTTPSASCLFPVITMGSPRRLLTTWTLFARHRRNGPRPGRETQPTKGPP